MNKVACRKLLLTACLAWSIGGMLSVDVAAGHAKSETDLRLCLERGVFEQEVKRDLVMASRLYAEVYESKDEANLVLEALARDVVCRLGMHLEMEARYLYQAFLKRGGAESLWMDYVSTRVPDSFLRKPVDWLDGEGMRFEWTRIEDRSWMGGVFVDFHEMDRDGIPCWRVRARALGPGYNRLVELYLDKVLLEPVFSRVRSRTVEPFERPWLPEQKDGQVPDFGDAELTGIILRQYPLRLGYEIETELFETTEGILLPFTVSVPSMEMIQNRKGERLATFRVVAENTGLNREFWVGQDKTGKLERVLQDSGQSTLVGCHDEPSGKDIVGGFGGVVMRYPREWSAIPVSDYLAGDPLRVAFLPPDCDVGIWYVDSDASCAGEENDGMEVVLAALVHWGFEGIEGFQRRFTYPGAGDGWRMLGRSGDDRLMYVGVREAGHRGGMILASGSPSRIRGLVESLDRLMGSVVFGKKDHPDAAVK